MRLIAEHREKVFQLFGDLSEYFRSMKNKRLTVQPNSKGEIAF